VKRRNKTKGQGGVKELIGKAMPIMDGQPAKGQEIKVLGGFGI
jgi:hypothetical protein